FLSGTSFAMRALLFYRGLGGRCPSLSEWVPALVPSRHSPVIACVRSPSAPCSSHSTRWPAPCRLLGRRRRANDREVECADRRLHGSSPNHHRRGASPAPE